MLHPHSRILVIMSERIGDAIFCTPALAWLRQCLPQASITLLALSKGSARVFEGNPALNEILIAPNLNAFKAQRDRWDVLIDFHHSKKTLSYVNLWGKTAYLSPRAGSLHQSTIALQFIQGLVHGTGLDTFDTRYRLFPQKKHEEKIKSLLQQHGIHIEQDPVLVGCHMGCYKTAQRLKWLFKKETKSHKTWPIAHFAALQKMLYEHYPQAKLLLTGSLSEAKLIHGLDKKIPNLVNIMGATSVVEMAALMPYLKVFVTGDTGPLHIAASTDVPIVALFGPSDPIHTGPKPPKSWHRVFYRMPMDRITPQEVFEGIQAVAFP